MLALLPQFVDPGRGAVNVQLPLLGAAQKVAGAVVLGVAAFAAGAAGDRLARRLPWLVWQHRLSGAEMVGLGIRLLLGGRSRPSRARRPRGWVSRVRLNLTGSDRRCVGESHVEFGYY